MQTRNARIETLGGAIVRFPFGVTVRRALVAVCGFAALASCATLVGCSSDEEEEPAVVEEPQDPEETQVSTEPGIPITITAEYAPGTNLAAKKPIPLESVTEEGYAQKNRIAFTDNGTDVSAVWEAGDQIYVVCNGKISLLTLKTGAGTKSGTFEGELAGYTTAPTANTNLICYVRNSRRPNAITVQADGTFKDNRDFQKQIATLAQATSLTVYRGTAKYGTGSNIVVNFSIYDTCLMKFEVTAANGVSVDKNTYLRYRQGDTQLANAGQIANASGATVYYLAVPSGTYSGTATLGYTNETIIEPRAIALGSKTSVTLEPGKFYVKKDLKPGYALGDYIYEGGNWGELQNHPDGNPGIARVSQLGTYDADAANGYKNGYAFALGTLRTVNNHWEDDFYYHFSDLNENSEYSGLEQSDWLANRYSNATNYAFAARTAYSYKLFHPMPSNYSNWFLPSNVLAYSFFQFYRWDDDSVKYFYTITNSSATTFVCPWGKTSYPKQPDNDWWVVRPFIAF